MKHPTPPALRFLDDALEEAAARHLLRTRREPAPAGAPSFCSNDYLDLARGLAPSRAAGSGSSRLVSGERAEHVELERASAELVGLPEALVFSSGYAANVGLLSALAGRGDLVVSDELNHASLVDGIRLSRARVAVVPHLDLGAVERALRQRPLEVRRVFVVTESYFSMDADAPDLGGLRRLCDEQGAALVVDEAHALGVLGPSGRGLCQEAGVRPDALIGTFGKAFGAAGAFVAGSPALVRWLWNRARTFVFSTGLSPVLAAAALEGLARSQREPHRRERVLANAAELRGLLDACGRRVPGFGPILPCIVGAPEDATAVADGLAARGIDARAIRPPSVPVGTARIRLTVTAAHEPRDIRHVASALEAVWQPGRR